MKKPLFAALAALLLTSATPRFAPAQTPYQDYMRDQTRIRAMKAANEEYAANRGAFAAQEKRGAALIRAKRATTKFQTRPFPLQQFLNTEWKAAREQNEREYRAQSALWQTEAKARGAKLDDMSDVFGLAIAMNYQAYTGTRLSNAGFRWLRDAYRTSFLKDAYFQGRNATQKQQLSETAMLHGSYALLLRREGKIAEAKANASQFIDAWWNQKIVGLLQIVAPYRER